MLQLRQLLKRYFSQAAPGISGAVALVAVLAGNVPAQASVPLRRADIEQILNRVELIPRGRSARTARVSDFLSIGDALRTAAASRAELRFNDGSLGRVGQRATFSLHSQHPQLSFIQWHDVAAHSPWARPQHHSNPERCHRDSGICSSGSPSRVTRPDYGYGFDQQPCWCDDGYPDKLPMRGLTAAGNMA